MFGCFLAIWMEHLNGFFVYAYFERYLENEEPTNWDLAPVPSVFEILPTQELQMDFANLNPKGIIYD